jgi:hypothetical protein
MRRDSFTAFLHLTHNRGPLPTFHNEQEPQGQAEHETDEGQEQFKPQAERMGRTNAP